MSSTTFEIAHVGFCERLKLRVPGGRDDGQEHTSRDRTAIGLQLIA